MQPELKALVLIESIPSNLGEIHTVNSAANNTVTQSFTAYFYNTKLLSAQVSVAFLYIDFYPIWSFKIAFTILFLSQLPFLFPRKLQNLAAQIQISYLLTNLFQKRQRY